jgi:hypothetical protein
MFNELLADCTGHVVVVAGKTQFRLPLEDLCFCDTVQRTIYIELDR